MATELLTNGSFETGTGQSPTSWTGTGIGRADKTAGLAPDGTGYYALGADSANHGGVIQQIFATEVGKTYTVTFKSGVSWQAANGDYNASLQVDLLNGAAVIESQNIDLPNSRNAGWGTYTFTFTATATQTTLKFTDTSPNGQADFDVGLDKVSVQEAASYKQEGEWGSLLDWPVVALHAVVLQDGKILTFGYDKNDPLGLPGTPAAPAGPGVPARYAMKHDIYDPVTGLHTTIDHAGQTPTDIFCAAAIIIPGTNQVLIAGGDNRPSGVGGVNRGVDDTNVYDADMGHIMLSPTGEMNYARWYPTLVTLPSGQIVIFGGSDGSGGGISTPEIFTVEEGWRKLTGAVDADVGAANSYPRAWVGSTGEIFYFATGRGTDGQIEVMALDPSGEGSLREVGTLPFTVNWAGPAIMYGRRQGPHHGGQWRSLDKRP